jgi:hypothetical protein
MTSRIVRALEHPHVDILVHPTGRRIGRASPMTSIWTRSSLDHIDLGITTARRAWIGPAQVLNTRSLDALLAWTRR